MSESTDEDVESAVGWTASNLRRLLTSMKGTTPEGDLKTTYKKGMKYVDWSKVAFQPFSPEECRKKWSSIMKKMRKLRSLSELIEEAENVISDPLNNRTIHPEVPKKPLGPRTSYFMDHYHKFKKKHPNMSSQNTFKLLYKKFEKLPEEKRMVYEKKYTAEILEYQKKMKEFSQRHQIHVKTVKLAAQYKKYEEEVEGLPAKPPRKGYEGTSKPDALKLSRAWRELKEAEKAEYKMRWIELKRQYALKLHTHLDRFSKEEQMQIIKEKGIIMPNKIPSGTLKMRQPGEPKMPSKVPFSYFSAEQFLLLKDKIPSIQQRRKEIHQLWKKTSIKKKESYKAKMHEAIRGYSANLQEWFMTLEPERQAKYLIDNRTKSVFLGVNKKTTDDQTKRQFGQTSDSEDEFIVSISDEEEDVSSGYEEEQGEGEEEEDEDIIMFEIN